MYPTPMERWSNPAKIFYRVSLPVATFLWLIPILAILWTSIRTAEDINSGNRWGLPSEWRFDNYIEIFTVIPMGGYLLNSIIITVPVVIVSIALATAAGYGLSKYHFRGQTLLFALFVGGNFIPFQILMVPVRELMELLNLYNTHFALILFQAAFQTGFCTLFMRNFIAALPDELIECARVEGLNELQIFWYIIVPLVRPALAALSVLIFVFVWNDFFWSLVLITSDSAKPVTTGISALRGTFTASWQLISAAAVVAALPPVLMFFFMQKHFVAGLTMGATKG